MDLGAIVEDISTDDAKLVPLSKNIANGISNGEATLLSLVEVLGTRLTHKEIVERCRAMNILAAVLNNIPPDSLSEKEAGFVSDFLHDRLRDQHVIIPKVITSIQAIIRFKHLPDGAAGKLLLQLFKEANIQSHMHKDRNTFYRILAYILENKLTEIASWGSDFVMNFIQATDGEKDPRNLLIIFQLVPVVLNNFPVGPFTEELFEELSCYFPVDFTPSVTNPDEAIITREDLAQALNLCLSHTNLFAPMLIPLILEKLDSNLTSSKLDSLKLLGICCERSYSPADLETFLSAIWRGLRKEVFMGGNESVNEEIFNFLRIAFATLSRSPRILNISVDLIVTECKHHLMEPELRLIHPASSVLSSIAESSESACKLVVGQLLPILYEQFLVKTASAERKNILTVFNKLVAISRKFESVKLAVEVSTWDESIATMFTLLSHSDLMYVNLTLEFFTLIAPELDLPSVEILQRHLLNLLTVEKVRTTEDTRRRLFLCLENTARSFPSAVKTVSVSSILSTANTLTTLENGADLEKLDFALNALASCTYILAIAEQVVPSLLEKIQVLCSELTAENRKPSEIEVVVQQLHIYLKCFSMVVKNGSSSTGAKRKRTEDSLSNEFSQFVCGAQKSVDILVEVVLLLRKFDSWLRGLDSTVALTVLKKCYFVANETVRFLIRHASESAQDTILRTHCRGLCEDQETAHQLTAKVPGLLLESLIGAAGLPLPASSRSSLIKELIQTVLQPPKSTCSSEDIEGFFLETDHQARIRLFATLVNKTKSDTELLELENKMTKLLQDVAGVKSSVNGHSGDLTEVSNAGAGDGPNIVTNGALEHVAHLFLWFVKALAVRGAASTDTWISKCVELMGEPSLGSLIANNFNILVEDFEYALNAESGCIYRFLYKQRVFLSSVPRLVAAYKQSTPDDPNRVNYIRALSNQLLHVPRSVLHMELNNVLPLVIASLTCEKSSDDVRLSCLKALDDLLADKANTRADAQDSVIVEYFHDVVPYLVTLASFKNNMSIRIAALQCLQKCAKFPVHMVVQEKPNVIDKLGQVLDDPKRLVRKEAVTARNLWILVAAPGGL